MEGERTLGEGLTEPALTALRTLELGLFAESSLGKMVAFDPTKAVPPLVIPQAVSSPHKSWVCGFSPCPMPPSNTRSFRVACLS